MVGKLSPTLAEACQRLLEGQNRVRDHRERRAGAPRRILCHPARPAKIRLCAGNTSPAGYFLTHPTKDVSHPASSIRCSAGNSEMYPR
jgi:hypothetical protein